MSTNGIIFNIQRFSLHDGPGIRTTVFLKGCPLSCWWCHNPESKRLDIQLSFSNDLCTNCKKCASSCLNEVHVFNNNTHKLNFSKCIACGNCVNSCPNNALTLIGYTICADEIVKIALKDLDYYQNSGGGITISGGEPCFQAEFLLEILKHSKKQGLHTCVETCGFASEQTFMKILNYVDLFLFDFKLYDENLHKKYTSASLKPIKNNLLFLDKHSAKVILRCPIIPDINDNLAHFQEITNLSKLNCVQRVELLPYHTLGLNKSKKIGNEYFLDTSFATKEQSTKWYNTLIKLDCEKLIDPNI